MNKFQAVRGTKDVIGEEALLWEVIESAFKGVMDTFQFEQIRTPAMENSALFKQSVGDATDIVQKEMFLVKRMGEKPPPAGQAGGADSEEICLRPEGTAAVVRSLVENSLNKIKRINKLYYYGPMFRAERPQKGRLRQFHQIGCEIFGSRSALADAEIIEALVQVLAQLSIQGGRLEINNLGDIEDRANFSQVLKDFLAKHVKELCEDCRIRAQKNALRVLDCKNPECRRVIEMAPKISDHVSKESVESFNELQKLLGHLRIPFEHNPLMVRGLDYYTHTVFELKHPVLGDSAQNTLAAGGRYNQLVKNLGGLDTPAVGFALGIERLILIMKEQAWKPDSQVWEFIRKKKRPFVAVVWRGEHSKSIAYQILSGLRGHQIRGYMDYEERSYGAQFEQANKVGARYAIILGDQELASESFELKDMDTQQQKKYPISAIDKIMQEIKTTQGAPGAAHA